MFHSSSQREHFFFEEAALARVRRQARTEYLSRFQDSASPVLTAEEERAVVRFHGQKLQELCRHLRFPNSVICTASHYLQRYYLRHTVMDEAPSSIMHLCIFVACKNEEFNIELIKFVGALPEPLREPERQFIRDNELLLLRRLQFRLVVHGPFRPLRGLLVDLTARFPEQFGGEQAARREVQKRVEALLRTYLLSDVGFCFAPSQIALAALHQTVGDNMLGPYLLELSGQDTDKGVRLAATLAAIQAAGAAVDPAPTKQATKALLEKLEGCRNQALNPQSEEYQRLQAEEERKQEETQTQKAREARLKQEEMLARLTGLARGDDGKLTKKRKRDAEDTGQPD